MKVTIQTLGCKVNQADSASIEGALRNNNYKIVDYTDNPDVWVINTCTVTAKSDHQSRQLIRKAVRSGAKVIATGCYARLNSESLSKTKGLSVATDNADKTAIFSYLKKLSTLSNDTIITNTENPESPLTLQPYYSERSRAFLKIQDGCNFSCSYCTVPLARGKSRSLSKDDVLTSVENFVSAGYREIVLTGVHIGSYGIDLDIKGSLVDITKKIASSYPEIRIRISSIEPNEFSHEFLALIKKGSVCPHLHIPLQSGSDKVLGMMKRGYRTGSYKQLINSILTECPDISIGTDVVAGFPGETDKDFDDTVKYLNDLPISYLHVFPFSKRPNTKASNFPNQISDLVKKARVKKLLELGEIKKKAYITKYLYHDLDVIVEKREKTSGYYGAISDNYLKVLVKSDYLRPKERLRVKVIAISGSNLITKPSNGVST